MFNTSVIRTVLILISAFGIIFSIPVPYSAKTLTILPSVKPEVYSEELLSGITHTSPVPEDFTTELQNVPKCETTEQRADCEAFLEAHISKDSREYSQLQTLKDSYKRLPRPLPENAAFWGYTELLQVLLNNGVPINKKYSLEKTLLHVAAEGGHNDLVTFLLTHGADIQAEDFVGSTPLHTAVRRFQYKTSKLLLDAGANVNATNKYKETPLFLVVESLSPPEYISHLLNRKAVTDYKKSKYVVGKDIIEILLKYKADTNISNYLGKTPLHVAAKNCNMTIVQLLIDGGANIDVTDNNNQTALHVAIESNNMPVVVCLFAMGCDITITDRNGKTALDIAEERNLTEIVGLLSCES